MNKKTNSKISAINVFFIFFIISAILYGAANGKLKEVTDASFASAKASVTLALSLIGIMALWLGLVRILEAGGLMYSIAKLVRPLVQKLFPDVPAGHPAMGAMMLNMSANALGLGNAATPLGLKAMTELDKLNPIKGTATNAMCLFLAINTSGLTILPLGVIGVRAAAGASRPADIFLPTLIATCASTVVAIVSALIFAKLDREYWKSYKEAYQNINEQNLADPAKQEQIETQAPYQNLICPPSLSGRFVALASILTFLAILIYRFIAVAKHTVISTEETVLGLNVAIYQAWKDFLVNEVLSYWLMPFLILLMLSYGLYKGVKIYEAVTDGAKQGFDIAIRIIPFLVAILVAIGMFRASGAMDVLTSVLGPLTETIGLPADVVPMAILRPLSGSGAFAVMSEIVSHDPNSYSAFVASVLNGCTETTFYVLAVYFGSVGVLKVRHALICGLLADLTGIIVASLTSSIWCHPIF